MPTAEEKAIYWHGYNDTYFNMVPCIHADHPVYAIGSQMGWMARYLGEDYNAKV